MILIFFKTVHYHTPMSQRTSSAAYAHIGQIKARLTDQSGGSMCMVQHMARTCTSMWVELEGANQILHISERGQSTYVFTYTRTYRLVPVLYWFAHMCEGHMYVCHMHVKGQIKCTNFMPGANQNARNPSQKCAWKWFGRIF